MEHHEPLLPLPARLEEPMAELPPSQEPLLPTPRSKVSTKWWLALPTAALLLHEVFTPNGSLDSYNPLKPATAEVALEAAAPVEAVAADTPWHEKPTPEFARMDNGYYQMPPAAEGLYSYWPHNPGVTAEDTCASYGVVALMYNLTKELKVRLPHVNVVLGEFNAPAHYSHRNGRDADLHSNTSNPDMNAPEISAFTTEDAIVIIETLLESEKVKILFYNDQAVIDAINKKHGYFVEWARWHQNHIHIRFADEFIGPESESCYS